MWKKLSGNKVTIQVGLRIYCADRNKIESWRYPAHRKAISNGWIRNSSMGYLNCYRKNNPKVEQIQTALTK